VSETPVDGDSVLPKCQKLL